MVAQGLGETGLTGLSTMSASQRWDPRRMRNLLNRIRTNSRERSIREEWDFQRRHAMGPSHQAEIDAIFSRYL